MSSVASYTVADIPWVAGAIVEARYAIAAVYALQIYEWFAGIEKEARLIYSSRWTSVKVAYLLCRYYQLLTWPLIMWAYNANHTRETCSRIGVAVHILLAPCQFFPQAVMVMRAYAFTGRDTRVMVMLGLCYAGLVGVDIWAFCAHIKMPNYLFYLALKPFTGCFPNYGSGVMGIRIGLSMLAAILMDLVSLVTVIIWCKKESDIRGGLSLARYFISQGLGAFVIVTVLNVAAAIAFFKPPSYHTGIGLPLILVIPNLVACRVILQLRRKVNPTDTEIWQQHSALINRILAPAPSLNDVWTMDNDSKTDTILSSLFLPR
ncbi:hypothetical protein FA15DRAFT_676335 [Coprinopsis marcescibilis]|uniref:DUF6533 domain-containing protein n=1 Tax=Coprinopsis marcescibilis TaxID=230819 RepID=A0A5C3KAY0_COPMA|nr:hypothetical protein FA15DRAFT_676335 [Coprinopsis marcescibilis]